MVIKSPKRLGDRFRFGKKLPSLASLLQEQDFETVFDILDKEETERIKWFGDICPITGENCLHVVLKSRPPARLVTLLLQLLVEYGIEEPELSVDDIGRTPLHLATGYSCTPDVIKALVHSPAGKMSTRAQDCFGHLPLHVAVIPYDLVDKGSYCHVAETSRIKPSEFNKILRTNIAILVAICPGSVHVTDDKGMTPLDHAKPLSFDKNFRKWVFKVAKVGGAVLSDEEINKRKKKVIDEVMQKSRSIRMDGEIPRLLSKSRPSTFITREPPRPQLSKQADLGASVWSLDASPY